jgi:DNA-binding protein H-NS
MMKQLDAIKLIGSMNFDELLAVKAKVEAAIEARISEERQRLTASLERLESLSQTAKGTKGIRGGARSNGHAKRTLAAKYRNPANPKETWAGRGLRPRWLVAALKGGKKKLADFAVDRKR